MRKHTYSLRETLACMKKIALSLQSLLLANIGLGGVVQVGTQYLEVLIAHIQRYSFSPLGALRWKKDLAEYAGVVQDMGIPSLGERFAQLSLVINVLIVAPESLLGLVNGSLRMSHKEVLRFIQLRQDFRSARVDGQTLQQVFTADSFDETNTKK
jgi:exocyst complex component 5